MNSLADMAKNKEFKNQLEFARNNGHLACFSRCENGYGIAPMWAHYGTGPNPETQLIEPHRGCCIAFCFESLVTQLASQYGDNFLHDFVSYRTTDYEPSIGISFVEGDNILELARDYVESNLWFKKNKCWQYESEYRLVVRNEPNDYIFHSTQNSILGIFAGSNTTESELKSILKLGSELGLDDQDLNVLLWDRGVPSTEPIRHHLESKYGG